MSTVVIASNNKSKIEEMRAVLTPFFERVISLKEAGVVCEPEETGRTFEENAFIKAEAVCRATGLCAVADDSGLCVEALGGAPGIYSARYAAQNHVEDANAFLLSQMEGQTDRRAYFASAVVLVRPDGTKVEARGEIHGRIAHVPRGNGGFGYDPIFEIEDGRTMAELSPEEKNRISHRGLAVKALAEKL